jgi:radical SAM protein with 4Fe4S-binding SPASM domain
MKPNGDVIFCPSLSFAMANYRKDGSLDKSLEKEKDHPFYNIKTSDLKECLDCRYLKICGGGCRANAIYEFNNYYGKDSTACATFPEWEKSILPILKKSHQKYFHKLINHNGKMPVASY